MTCPCLDCEFRHVGCHVQCAVYRAWKEERGRASESLRGHVADRLLNDQRWKMKAKRHTK